MPTLNEVKYAALIESTRATKPITLNELECLQLEQLGYTGTLNERWYGFLKDLGYSGNLNGMQIAYWKSLGCLGRTWNELAYCFWAGGGFVVLPDWAAAGSEYMFTGKNTSDEDHELMAQLNGAGSPTFVTEAGLSLPDFEGVMRANLANEPPWYGSRKVTNYLLDTGNFAASRWGSNNNGVGSPIVKTPDFGVAPDGTTTACRLQCALNGATGSTDWSYMRQQKGGLDGKTTVKSVWLKSLSGTVDVALSLFESSAIVTVTTDWQRFSVPFLSSVADHDDLYIGLRGTFANDDSCDILVWNPQMEDTQDATNKNPSDYIESVLSEGHKWYGNENGNTVSSNVVTEGVGGILPVRSVENLIVQSEALLTSPWTQPTATGTAEILPDGWCRQEAVAQRPYLDQGGVPVVSGRTYRITAHIRNFTGSTNRIFGGVVWDDNVVPSADGIYTTTYTAGATGNVNIRVGLGVDSPTTATVEMNYVMLEDVTDNPSLRPSAYIKTEAARVTENQNGEIASTVENNVVTVREPVVGCSLFGAAAGTWSTPLGSVTVVTPIQMNYDIANHDDAQGAYYCEFTPLDNAAAVTGDDSIITVRPEAFGLMYTTNGTTLKTYDGSAVTSVTIDYVDGTSMKFAVGYDASLSDAYVEADGDRSADNIYDGSYQVSGDLILLKTFPRAALIRNVRRYDLNYAAGKAKIDELMA